MFIRILALKIQTNKWWVKFEISGSIMEYY